MALREVLKIEEREIISRELSRHKSARYIGQMLGRHHSTISREIDRNGGAPWLAQTVEQRRLCSDSVTFGVRSQNKPARHQRSEQRDEDHDTRDGRCRPHGQDQRDVRDEAVDGAV